MDASSFIFRVGLTGLLIAACPAWAVDTRREPDAVPAPTQAVISKPLDALNFHSDTRNIQAIIDREGEVAKPEKPEKPEKIEKAARIEKAERQEKAEKTERIEKSKPAPAENHALEAIVDKTTERQAAVTPTVQSTPASTPPVLITGTGIEITRDEEPGFIDRFLTSIRIFAIRWHEVLDIVLVSSMAIFTFLVYRISRTQQKILLQTIQAIEHAALVARHSAEKAEHLVKRVESVAEEKKPEAKIGKKP